MTTVQASPCPEHSDDWRTAFGVCLLLILGVFFIFGRTWGYGFVNFDDDSYFSANYHVKTGPTWKGTLWALQTGYASNWHPLTWLSLMLDAQLFGPGPAGPHLTNVILHAVNSVLLFLVLRRLTGALWPSALVAAVFAIHPLRVESVVWATERRDVLMGFFALLCVLAYLRAVERGRGGALNRAWHGTAVALFGLALLSKSVVVGLPVVLLLLDLYPLRRHAVRAQAPGGRSLTRLALEKAPFAALAAAVAAITLAVGAGHRLMTSLEMLGVLPRLAISAYALVFYLWKTVAPWPLSPLYTLYFPVLPSSPTYVIPAIIVVAITLGSVAACRRWPAGLIAWASYVVLLLPVVGLLHNGAQIAADRYTYLSCAPWALLAGAGLGRCRSAARSGRLSPRLGAAVLGAAALYLVTFAGSSVRQEAVWRDSVSLWTHAASVDPASDIAVFYLGWALEDAGRFDEARAHFESALRRVPDGLPDLKAQLDLHLGIVEQRAGRPAEAERYFRAALVHDPTHAVALIRLGTVLLEQGQAQEAEAAWTRALEAQERWSRYHLWELGQAIGQVPTARAVARGRLALALGLLLQRQGEPEQALEQYRLATTLLPDDADAWNGMGVAYALRGSMAQALDGFTRALRLRPGDPRACRNARQAAAELGASPPELAGCREQSG